MNNSKLLSVIGLSTVIVVASSIAQAGPHRHRGGPGPSDRARVVQVDPIYETRKVRVAERERCRRGYTTVYHGGNDVAAATLVGGALGGLVGNQLAHEGNRAPATVVGAAVGAVVGHEIGKNQSSEYQVHRRPKRCKEVVRYRNEQHLVGYRVKYRYHGKTYWTRTKNHPGKVLDVKVKVRPVEF